MDVAFKAELLEDLQKRIYDLKANPDYQKIVGPRDEVLSRFQPIFHIDRLEALTEPEFRAFLNIENNHHWTGLHRQGPKICSDMQRLRQALKILLSETGSVSGRLDQAIDMIPGMGRAIATAIMLVKSPHAYGVWNTTSEGAMKRLGLWPTFDRGETVGEKYVKVNEVLVHLASALNTDLWTVDTLWWHVERQSGTLPPSEEPFPAEASETTPEQRFGLEQHLHFFLRDNWEKTDLGREWEIYSEQGAPQGGINFPCGVGYIDILARHRSQRRWLVIELKRNQSSDDTVGQILRYMGWVRLHMADAADKVEGLIIAHQANAALHYALTGVPDVSLKLYQVQFQLVASQHNLLVAKTKS